MGGRTQGQCHFQRGFSDLGIPLAPRGGETFFIQHCRGQTGGPLPRSIPRRGPEGVLCYCLGSWAWALHGWQVGLGSVSLVPISLSQSKGGSPRASLCLYIAQKLVWVL